MISSSVLANDATPHKPSAFNYDGTQASDEGWGELSANNAACEIGTSQSPINISYTTIADLPKLKFDYRLSNSHIENKENTLVITPDEKNTLSVDGHDYQLKEIRLHSPSEHTVLDKPYALEIHLIHKDGKGQILIVAVFSEADEEQDNEAFAMLSEHLPGNTTEISETVLNITKLLPKKMGYFSYTGSLTWPPCTENVQWRVLKNPISFTSQQFHKLVGILKRNSRLVQPVYMRTVSETKD